MARATPQSLPLPSSHAILPTIFTVVGPYTSLKKECHYSLLSMLENQYPLSSSKLVGHFQIMPFGTLLFYHCWLHSNQKALWEESHVTDSSSFAPCTKLVWKYRTRVFWFQSISEENTSYLPSDFLKPPTQASYIQPKSSWIPRTAGASPACLLPTRCHQADSSQLHSAAL